MVSVSNSRWLETQFEKRVVQVNLRLQRIQVTRRKRTASYGILLDLKDSIHRHSKYARIITLNCSSLLTLSVRKLYGKCVLCTCIKHTFAADLESHIDCMRAYLLAFQNELDSLNELAAGVTNKITQDV